MFRVAVLFLVYTQHSRQFRPCQDDLQTLLEKGKIIKELSF